MADEPTPERPRLIGIEEHITSFRKVYFNGFSCTITPADVVITLKLDDVQALTLHASYETSKTLVLKLGGLLKLIEQRTGRPILTTDEMYAALVSGSESSNEQPAPNSEQQ